jgi:integrase
LFLDSLTNKRARTVPLADDVVPIVHRWAEGKDSDDFLFAAAHGGPLYESNSKRMVDRPAAAEAIGVPRLRVPDQSGSPKPRRAC